MSRSSRRASRLAAALVLALLTQAVSAQVPKDPPKDKDKKDEKPPTPDEQKAREAFNAGKLDEALKLLQAAAKANPTIVPKVVAARWCVETQQGPQARLLIEQAAAEDPKHPEVFLTNASFALGEGRITDAILSCDAALGHSDNPRWTADEKRRFQREARLGLVASYDTRGDFASVKSHLIALLAADSKNAQYRQRLARANFLLNLPDEALNDLKAAFKEDPTLDPPELTLAQLWTAKQDFPKAEEWYGKAVTAHKDSAKVHRGFAGYLLDRGRIEPAKAHLAAAQKIEPTARDTKALAGLFARYAKDYPAATAVFEELMREYPTFGFATANLALVLAESGDTKAKERAVGLSENHARQNQRSGEARAIYAYCLFKAGRTADAGNVAKSAIGLGSTTADGAYFLAKVLADRGATEDAHKLIKAAVESKEAFVYRKDGEALLAELDKKVAPPKK